MNNVRALAILLAAILIAGCRQTCPPANRTEKTIPVAALADGADAGAGQTTEELLTRCQASADQCQMLCWRAGGYGPYYSTCELVSTDAGLAVHFVHSNLCGL